MTENNDFNGDASEELLLKEQFTGTTLVINDNNGAITPRLSGEIYSYTPSYLGKCKIDDQIKANGLNNIHIITSILDFPESVDNVILRLPKSLDFLEYILQIIGTKYKGSSFTACGMVKYFPISMVRLTEKYFDNVKTSLAQKKARLLLGSINLNAQGPEYPTKYKVDDDLEILSYPGVFSSKSLDLGTAYLLPHIPRGKSGKIIDLGCGSGVLGIVAKKRNPLGEVILLDESFLSIDSARETFEHNKLEGTFITTNILEGIEDSSCDLVLCNPPFHIGTQVSTDIAIDMFKESKRVLKKGGILLVVANRHLGYHKKLREIFHNLRILDHNQKFNIYSNCKQ